MLRGIPNCLSPELLKVIAEMGHGDVLVIGDAFYPSASSARHSMLVRTRCCGFSPWTGRWKRRC